MLTPEERKHIKKDHCFRQARPKIQMIQMRYELTNVVTVAEKLGLFDDGPVLLTLRVVFIWCKPSAPFAPSLILYNTLCYAER